MIYFSMLLRPMIVHQPKVLLLAAGVFLTILVCALPPGDSLGGDNAIFQQFTQHISRQIHKDKQAFAQANTCVSWFYKAGKTSPPAVQGIGWSPSLYPRPKRIVFSTTRTEWTMRETTLPQTQALLSVSSDLLRIRPGRRPER